MMYRIRYRAAGTAQESETLVEANSPTEALVKFRHTANGGNRPSCTQHDVTSVCAEDTLVADAW